MSSATRRDRLNGVRPRGVHPVAAGAFTLVELMVVISIVALLIAIVMPAVVRARDSARQLRCASNLHQLVVAVDEYVAQSCGRYPLNTPNAYPPKLWYDDERIGSIIHPLRPPVPAGVPGGGVYVCPNDGPDPVALSYAMNAWASYGSSFAPDAALLAQIPRSGRQWSPRVHHASQMILLAEAYSWKALSKFALAGPTVGACYATAGAPSYAPVAVTTAGQRFGGAGGVRFSAARFGVLTSELAFYRHRTYRTPGAYAQPVGRVNIAYADGHVACKSNADLVLPSGQLTGDSYWSPADHPGD